MFLFLCPLTLFLYSVQHILSNRIPVVLRQYQRFRIYCISISKVCRPKKWLKERACLIVIGFRLGKVQKIEIEQKVAGLETIPGIGSVE